MSPITSAKSMGDISDYKNKDKLRREYSGPLLTQENIAENPIEQFRLWFDKALDDDLTDANAMILATATKEGKPSVRTVLLKGFDDKGFRFFTNYNSRKGRELKENPHASLCFYWAELNRQVRIEGTVAKTSAADSAAYFSDRPRNSQLSARASKQSAVVSSRKELEDDFERVKEELEGKEVTLPKNWGGFILKPFAIEFWQGRPGRLHDRILYNKKNDGWSISRLAP